MTNEQLFQQGRPRKWVIYVILGILSILWGSTWIVIKENLDDVPPFTFAGVRFVVAFIVMALIAPWIHKKEGGEKPPVWLWLLLGFTNFSVSFGIVYYVETILPSGLVSVLWGVFPGLMGVSAHFFLKGERLTLRSIIGLSVGFLGVLLLFATDVRNMGSEAIPVALLFMISPLACVVGTTMVKRYGGKTSSALLNRNAMCVGAVLLLLAAGLFERDAEVNWTMSAIFSMLYLAVFGTVVTFSLLYWIMRYTKATQTSWISYIIPVVALSLGWFFGNEPITITILMGTTLIVFGVALPNIRFIKK